MAVVTACDFSGTGPAGTALSPSNTGASQVSSGSGASSVSTATGAVGTSGFAGLFTVPASNVSALGRWTVTGGTLVCAFSVYFQIPATPTATKRWFGVRYSSGYALTLQQTNAGLVQVQDSAGASQSISTALTAGAEYRAEILMTVATATTGQYTVHVYDSTNTSVGSVSSSTANLGTANLAAVDGGVISNGTSVAWSSIVSNIRYAVGQTTEIGPLASSSPPTASFTDTTSGLTVNVDGTGSTAVSPATITGYDWNWGDSTTHGTGSTASHTYSASGTYTITLTVTDSNSLTGNTTHTVSVPALGAYVYNGTAWVTSTAQLWNGTAWVPCSVAS